MEKKYCAYICKGCGIKDAIDTLLRARRNAAASGS